MQTVSFNADTVQREWHVVDVAGLPLGRIAARIALVLRGKHKPTYTPHADCGDYVVVVNAGDIKLSGRKIEKKLYHRHSGYFGGLKTATANELLERHPTRLVEFAVKGMLPRGPLGRRMFKKLKVYAGGDHPHAAQNPNTLELTV